MNVIPFPTNDARLTVALVYDGQSRATVMRVRRELESRGFAVKKEYACGTKRFDFGSVDVVVGLKESLGAGQRIAIDAAADRDGVNVVLLANDVDHPTWRQLARFGSSPAVVRPVTPLVADAEENAALAAMYAEEAAELRATIETMERDLSAARADNARLSKEVATAEGRARKLEADLASARDRALDSSELAGRVSGLAAQVRQLEATGAEQRKGLLKLRDERDQARAERDELKARGVDARTLASLKNEYDRLREEHERLKASIATAPAAPPADLLEAIRALRVLARVTKMSTDDALAHVEKAMGGC